MEKRSAEIVTICENIDHCFSFALWCEDFAPFVDPEDMMAGQARAFDLVSDATRLQSFLALRKLDDFFGGVKPKAGDLTAADFGIDVPGVLAEAGEKFLSKDERETVNKEVAHLTESLSLERESEVGLHEILKRSIPVLTRLVAELRKLDTAQEATQWLDRTSELVERARNFKTPAEKHEEAQRE